MCKNKLVAVLALLSVAPTLEALNLQFFWDHLQYKTGEEFLPVWNPIETKSADEQDSLQAFVKNWMTERHLMKVELDSEGLFLRLCMQERYLYEKDFVAYKKKQSSYAQEQITTVRYLIKKALENPQELYPVVLDYAETVIRVSGDEHLQNIVKESIEQSQSILIRKYLDIPSSVLSAHPDFVKFLLSNNLVSAIVEAGHTVTYDEQTLMPYLMKEDEMRPWSEIQEELKGNLHYVYTRSGLGEGILPVRPTRPSLIASQPAIQIVTRQATFGQTYHSWIRLIDHKGVTFSFGFWGSDAARSSAWQAIRGSIPFIENQGKFYSPDPFEELADKEMMQGYSDTTTLSTYSLTKEEYKEVLSFLVAKRSEQAPEWGANFRYNSASFVIEVFDHLSTLNPHMDLRSKLSSFPGAYQLWQWQQKGARRRSAILYRLKKEGASYKALEEVRLAPLDIY